MVARSRCPSGALGVDEWHAIGERLDPCALANFAMSCTNGRVVAKTVMRGCDLSTVAPALTQGELRAALGVSAEDARSVPSCNGTIHPGEAMSVLLTRVGDWAGLKQCIDRREVEGQAVELQVINHDRHGFVLQEGDIVQRVEDTGELLRYAVTHIDDRANFWGDLGADIGSASVCIERIGGQGDDVEQNDDDDDGCTVTEDLMIDLEATERVVERASFCQICYLHFPSEFVTWLIGRGTHFAPIKGGAGWYNSACDRCAATHVETPD